MPQSEHSASRGPKRRGDATRPASTRSGARRGGDRRPYPTAAATTRISPAKPDPAGTGSRSRGSATTPTPATVWTAGPVPIDLHTPWPTPIITTVVGSFSEPGARVALLPWPVSPARPRLALVDSGGVIDRSPVTGPDDELAAALATVASLDRTARVVRVAVDPTALGARVRSSRVDLVDDGEHPPFTGFPQAHLGVDDGVLDPGEDAPADTDLVITSLRSEDGDERSADLLAAVAARLLRVGGILVVLTHCDWTSGELIDPTGAVVASAQNADLLYLQHIVALHAPVHGGRFTTEPPTAPDDTEAEDRARHRAVVRGLPAPHQRIHSDVLVFAQPHEHEPPRPAPAEQADESGVIR
ncbi:hypothetical protein UO65_0096 [Actinokineospora spheciospongiae]|uniref:Uncharacterized protein n=1 Tax=Actinokineospora spheciospongiae TaxID=909613 RepID=W7JET0_9PSEU|nr:hypothetical protein [Actinokineospora spheciospongiae]EWC64489.1 hypothetical protein UO65_0096 [Actinokineospora spheciospongiae]